jgi:Ran GTPase-activating protein (RanGAP) involved in mRNA processing and transport
MDNTWLGGLSQNTLTSLVLSAYAENEGLWLSEDADVLDIAQLVQVLQTNTSVQEVYLNQNKISEQDLSSILTVLAENKKLPLAKLSLVGNTLKGEALQALLTLISQKRTLSYLDISSCKLGKDSGGETFFTGLAELKKCPLTVVNVNKNKLKTTADITALCAFLQSKECQVAQLSISNNAFAYEDAKALTAAIVQSKTLVEFTCLRTKVNMTLLKQLRPVLRANAGIIVAENDTVEAAPAAAPQN